MRPLGQKTAIGRVLAALDGVRRNSTGWMARCPAHADNTPSLSVNEGEDGRVLLKCFAGCSVEAITSALGLHARDLFLSRTRQLSAGRSRCSRIRLPHGPHGNHADARWAQVAQDAHVSAWASNRSKVEGLSDDLGISLDALRDIRVGWLTAAECKAQGGPWCPAFTIPERDGANAIVGVALRFHDGRKGFIKGGRRGLVIPASVWRNPPSHLFAVEGATDCAAMLTTDLPAVARASCTHGAKELGEWLACHDDTAVTIVADRDGPGNLGGVGVQAELQALLRRPVALAHPPAGYNDVRDALKGGAL